MILMTIFLSAVLEKQVARSESSANQNLTQVVPNNYSATGGTATF